MISERFESYVEPEPNTGCWLWTGGLTWQGYGVFSIHSRNHRAHRVTYEAIHGPVAPGMHLDHTCRVRSCCNPDHVRQVTPRENCMAPGSLNRAKANYLKTHCREGHLFDERNTYRRTSKQGARTYIMRRCRKCHARKMAAFYARKREAGA